MAKYFNLEQLSQLNQGVYGFGHLTKMHRIKIPNKSDNMQLWLWLLAVSGFFLLSEL
jgi:hypothetical protein